MTFLPADDIAQTVLTASTILPAIVILWTCICTLNYMTPRTAPASRLSYLLMGVGAAALLLGPAYFDHVPSLGGAVLTSGTAILLITERLYSRKVRERYARKLGQPRRPWWG